METFADDPALTPENYTSIRLGSGRVSRGQTISFDMVDEGGAVAIFSPQNSFQLGRGGVVAAPSQLESLASPILQNAE